MVADASIGYSIQGERNEGKKRNQDKGKVQQQTVKRNIYREDRCRNREGKEVAYRGSNGEKGGAEICHADIRFVS